MVSDTEAAKPVIRSANLFSFILFRVVKSKMLFYHFPLNVDYMLPAHTRHFFLQ